jgi:hypothetical protein
MDLWSVAVAINRRFARAKGRSDHFDSRPIFYLGELPCYHEKLICYSDTGQAMQDNTLCHRCEVRDYSGGVAIRI